MGPASWDTDKLHHYNHERYPLEFLTTDYLDDKSISLRVIDQNRKPHMKSL